MIIEGLIKISPELIKEAYDYALKSKKYTSDRHDFHEGGFEAKQRKMFEGKLGEKIFKMFLIQNNIPFEEDETNYNEADIYDFVVNGIKIDVKTRTQEFHKRTLEMVEQFQKNPKDVYVSVKLDPETKEGYILGWCTKADILKINRVENNGYLNNYVLYDNELSSLDTLISLFLN